MKCPDCGVENLPGEETCSSCHASLIVLSASRSKGSDQRILEGTLQSLKPHDALSVAPNDTVAQAVGLMRSHKMGCVLVAQRGDLAGIFTERDLLRKVAGQKKPEQTKISEVMRSNIECLNEDDTVAFAFHQMALHDYRHIPVRRKSGDLGVISARDLLRYLCK